MNDDRAAAHWLIDWIARDEVLCMAVSRVDALYEVGRKRAARRRLRMVIMIVRLIAYDDPGQRDGAAGTIRFLRTLSDEWRNPKSRTGLATALHEALRSR